MVSFEFSFNFAGFVVKRTTVSRGCSLGLGPASLGLVPKRHPGLAGGALVRPFPRVCEFSVELTPHAAQSLRETFWVFAWQVAPFDLSQYDYFFTGENWNIPRLALLGAILVLVGSAAVRHGSVELDRPAEIVKNADSSAHIQVGVLQEMKVLTGFSLRDPC